MSAVRIARPQSLKISTRAQAVWGALALFVVWMAATYFLEGRIDLIRQSPVGAGRWTYVLVANVLIGTVGAGWALSRMLGNGLVSLQQMGFRSGRRTLVAVVLAAAAGAALLIVQKQVVWEPVLLINTFALVLQTTIAEVLVCWVVFGTGIEQFAKGWGRVAAIFVAILASNLVFGIYHYAHSAPFNQTAMVLFLMIPGLVTSLVYFLGRDIYATIIVQNCLGMIGVAQSVNREFFGQPLVVLYLLTVLSVAALLGVHWVLHRQAGTDTRPTSAG
jgi:hypothetical protein